MAKVNLGVVPPSLVEAGADSKVVMEMIRLLLQYSKGSAQTKTGVQKLLYELKRGLPDNNPVKSCLPHYWFKAGAFSEPVSAGMAELERSGIAYEEKHDTYSLIRLRSGNSRLIEHDDSIAEAREKIQQIARKAHPLYVHKEMRSQYEEDAPTRFYVKFKLDFMPKLESHSRMAGRGGADSDQAENLSEILAEATASLPKLPMFGRFKRAYFDFEDACYKAFKQTRKDGRRAELIAMAHSTSRRVWDTFAHGARIIKHDKAYDSRVPEWQAQFDREVEEMARTTDGFYLHTLEVVGSDDGLEQAIAWDDFVDHVLEYRKHKEIAYVKFFLPGEQTWKAPDRVKKLPEYKTFMDQGHLDWILMERLSDLELRSLMDCSTTNRAVYVAYADKPSSIAYRMITSSADPRNARVP